MSRNRWGAAFAGAAIAAAALAPPVGTEAPPQTPSRSRDVKSCSVCHKPGDGQLWAYFDGVSMKSKSMQLKLDDGAEVVRFDQGTLKVVGRSDAGGLEKVLRGIRKGHEVRVAWSEGSDGVKVISEISVKPPMAVEAEKLVRTGEVEKLVAGRERFTLVDSRPPLKFQDGTIPGAVNVPFPAFQKNLDKLPKDKGELLVFFCGGVT